MTGSFVRCMLHTVAEGEGVFASVFRMVFSFFVILVVFEKLDFQLHNSGLVDNRVGANRSISIPYSKCERQAKKLSGNPVNCCIHFVNSRPNAVYNALIPHRHSRACDHDSPDDSPQAASRALRHATVKKRPPYSAKLPANT